MYMQLAFPLAPMNETIQCCWSAQEFQTLSCVLVDMLGCEIFCMSRLQFVSDSREQSRNGAAHPAESASRDPAAAERRSKKLSKKLVQKLLPKLDDSLQMVTASRVFVASLRAELCRRGKTGREIRALRVELLLFERLPLVLGLLLVLVLVGA